MRLNVQVMRKHVTETGPRKLYSLDLLCLGGGDVSPLGEIIRGFQVADDFFHEVSINENLVIVLSKEPANVRS